MTFRTKGGLIAAFAFLLGVSLTYLASRRPGPPPKTALSQNERDSALVSSLLSENLKERRFSFSTIATACSDKRVLPLDDSPAHQRVIAAIEQAITGTIAEQNQPNSPVRKLRRINEASRYFEDGILTRIHTMPGFRCEIPTNRSGEHQRAGYPDLRITDEASGLIFYLDPKLLEQGSANSTFRSFYFEPKNETLKITDAAVHLLAGIEHDGRTRAWTFTGWRIVDLSTLSVRLKAEFQTNNAGLYQKTRLSLPASGR